MLVAQLFLAALSAFAQVSAWTADAAEEDHDLFTALLKRQEPGTPAYNCHDNCGQAITISKATADVCKDPAFLADYKACLQCAGPDNYNIWRYYGGTLTKVGSGCALGTTPLAGKQPDVGPAVPAGGSVSSAVSSGAVATVTAVSTSSSPASSPASVATASGAGVTPSVAAGNGTRTTAGLNTTSSVTTSSPPLQSTDAAINAFGKPARIFSAVVLGAMFLGV